jgi:hypothetical protein
MFFNVSWSQLNLTGTPEQNFATLDLLIYLEDKDYGFTIPVTRYHRTTVSTWTIVGSAGILFCCIYFSLF